MAYDAQRDRLVMHSGSVWNQGLEGLTRELENDRPGIRTAPAAQVVAIGRRAALQVNAVGAPELTYAWRRAGEVLVPTPRISGVDTPMLVIDPAESSDEGLYDVVVTNACGQIISPAAQLRVRPPGDANCDNRVDFFDIDPFLLALLDPPAYETQFPLCHRDLADLNADGALNFLDIDPFLDCLFGVCP